MYNQNEKIEKAEKIPTFFRFEDLRIYHKALDYANWLQDVTMLFPDNDKSQFVLRFNDSARNIALFIVEGSARNKSQFVYNLKMAKSAIRECMVFTTLAYKQNNISDTQEDESRNHLMEMTKMIGALISSLQRSNGQSNNGHNNSNNHSGNYRYEGKGNDVDEKRTNYEYNDNNNLHHNSEE